ncbi:MAG: DNA polymerase III subunit delta [Hyphomicrobiales bacterium]|nr:DNA polymerase III subunit delta [Hyphomicrobiales bacterium]
MVAVKSDDVARLIRSPKPNFVGYLVYGADAVGVADRARELCRALSAAAKPASDIIRLTESDMAQDPARLAVELGTLPMFGGPPVVWAKGAPALSADDVSHALAPSTSARLVIEAGALAKSSKLRALFETRADLAALPCYGDDVDSVAALIETSAARAGLKLDGDALKTLKHAFAANAALARTEMEKLCLYAAGDGVVTAEAIEACVGDPLDGVADAVVNAAFSGQAPAALRQASKLVSAGLSPQALLAMLNSHGLRLLRVRARMDQGEPFATAVKCLRPPLFFKAERTFSSQIRTWSSANLAQTIAALGDAVRASRLNPALETSLMESAVIRIAALARPVNAER